jgi:tetratricopeptide (TPR) repeat protein
LADVLNGTPEEYALKPISEPVKAASTVLANKPSDSLGKEIQLVKTDATNNFDNKAVARMNECIQALDPSKTDTLSELFRACFDFEKGGVVKTAQLGKENIAIAALAVKNLLSHMKNSDFSGNRNPYQYVNTSILFEVCGKIENVLEMLENAAELDPDDPALCFDIALTYEDLNKFEEVFKWHRRAIELNPSLFQARHHLAFWYWKCGYYKSALEEFAAEIAYSKNNSIKQEDRKALRFAKRMVKYLEEKIKIFGPKDEDLSPRHTYFNPESA